LKQGFHQHCLILSLIPQEITGEEQPAQNDQSFFPRRPCETDRAASLVSADA